MPSTPAIVRRAPVALGLVLALVVALVVAILVVASSVRPAFAQSDDEVRQAELLNIEAQAAFDGADFETALEKWREVYGLYANPVTLWNIARTYEEMDEYLQAKATFEQYELFPGLGEADAADAAVKIEALELRIVAEAAIEEPDLEAAEGALVQAIAVAPSANASLRLAEVLVLAGRYDDATARFDEAESLAVVGSDTQRRARIGTRWAALWRQVDEAGESDAALEPLDILVAEHDDRRAERRRADVLVAMERYDEALVAYRAYAERDDLGADERRAARARIDELLARGQGDEDESRPDGDGDTTPTTPPDDGVDPLAIAGWTVTGFSVAAAGTGLIILAVASGTHDDILTLVEERGDRDEYERLVGDLESQQSAMIAAFVTAGGLAVVGSVLLTLAYSGDDSADGTVGLSVGPSGVVLRTRF